MKKLLLCLGLACALGVQAYLPPVDEKNGVKVAIDSFPQKIERPGANPYAWPLGVTEVAAAAQGATVREFPVVIENTTDRAVTGTLDVWMNDDWTVKGPQGKLALAPKERKTLTYTGTSKATALDALYPVHARFTPNGVADGDAVHPIAVFMFKNPRAPRVVGPKVRHVQVGGPQSKPVTSADPAAFAAQAKAAARVACTAGTDAAAGRWQLTAEDGTVYGAAVVKGPHGLIDGALAFSDGTREIVFNGFHVDVVARTEGSAPAPQADITAEKGTLRIRWSIPGTTPDVYGYPRFDDLAVGPASESVKRVYAGFGNVLQDPKAFSVGSGGFGLSTRHVGADYANGLSVVQAVDVVPDRLVCNNAKKIFALHAHHNATFTFVPSKHGAFEAARRFRSVAGYKKSPGHDVLGARMCLDQWGGDYRRAAKDLAKAAKYGVTDAIFIKHDWQRWGYDYRLPEIYPPRGDAEGFGIMREACRTAGMLFCPHDNYTDIYPDAANYSYNLTVFNLDGTPQRAWFNPGRHALSYRWAPHAFHPWTLRNAKLLKAGYDPEAIFVDVLTAMGPIDYLDRQGHFHSKNETSRNWGKAFATYRRGFQRPQTVCVSEAGEDHLVGIADAGESDHLPASRWMARTAFADSERTPWHDIVTHGYYVLFAGGLGGRYQEAQWNIGGDRALHGYGSDDYLSNTVIGGRNPMCDGPFSRDAVMTYWLQHDACAELARADFLALAYADDNIHRQHATFTQGGEVWSNRETNRVWRLPAGVTLPPYGYYAKTATTESGIILKDGVRCAFAKGPQAIFVDARAPRRSDAVAVVKTLGAETVSPTHLRVKLDWKMNRTAPEFRPFVHVCSQTEKHTEGIVFQCLCTMRAADFAKVGAYKPVIELRVPATCKAGTYDIWYGAWDPKLGGRLGVAGSRTDGASRLSAGTITVVRDATKITQVTWAPDARRDEGLQRERALGVNREHKAVDFGGVVTDGSFRLVGDRLIPLPSAEAFTATIDLALLGGAGKTVKGVESVDPEADAAQPVWQQQGDRLTLTVDAKAFAYKVCF